MLTKEGVYQKDLFWPSSSLPLFLKRREMQNGLVFWIWTTTKLNVKEGSDKGHYKENEVLAGKR